MTSPAIGTQALSSPATISLEKSQNSIVVVCKKECFQDGNTVIASNTEQMAAGNLLLGGVVGLGIDAASGAMNKYTENNQIAIVAIPGCKPKV